MAGIPVPKFKMPRYVITFAHPFTGGRLPYGPGAKTKIAENSP